MGREIRKVPADWSHPKGPVGDYYQPLYDGARYQKDAKEFMELANSQGLQAALDTLGTAPNRKEYMPDWPESECTHYMLYETCSPGTPVSPAFPNPENLAWWADLNKVSLYSRTDDLYRRWLEVIKNNEAI